MLNRPFSIFKQKDLVSKSDRSWDVDAHPEFRLFYLFLIISVPFLAVVFRLFQIQGNDYERFLTGLDKTFVSYEEIPSYDGRIFSSDGQVLARDVRRFNVLVHYRWLQQPPDSRWLRQQIYSRLSRSERSDSNQVEATEREVLAVKGTLWENLADITETQLSQLEDNRLKIQKQVEHVSSLVNAKHNPEVNPEHPDLPSLLADSNIPKWKAIWIVVADALTTPPERAQVDTIIVLEEEDYHTILEEISLETAAEIESHPELFPGVKIEVSAVREYPQGNVAPHVVGLRSAVNQELLDSRRKRLPDGDPLDYKIGDRIGKNGVERSYDHYLKGLRGLRKIVKNRHKEIISTEIVRKPSPGGTLELTIPLALQRQVEQLLDTACDPDAVREPNTPIPTGGCIVAIDVYSGEVLAAAVAPRFDLNDLINVRPEVWRSILNDVRRPLFPRATQMTLPAGSIFKTVTSAAILQSGKIDPDAHMFCQGYLDDPEHHRCYIYQHYGTGHSDINLTRAIAQSCNVYFFSAARRMGAEPICRWARNFGFGRPTGIDLPGEKPGNLPYPNKKLGTKKIPWYSGDTLGLAIGQSRLTVTPLQVATMMAAIANGGNLVTPHVVRGSGPSFLNDGSRRLNRTYQARPIPGLSSSTIERIQEGLQQVVSHPRGTGFKRVRHKLVSIAGKTGTAEVGGGKKDHAWFAGYVPAERPQIAFAIVLEHGGSGGRAAGPVAKQLVQHLLDSGLIEPTQIAQK